MQSAAGLPTLRQVIPSAIAMDVRPGPLARAKENIDAYGLNPYIETRLSDGLEALEPGEGDTLSIAGMGGRVVFRSSGGICYTLLFDVRKKKKIM